MPGGRRHRALSAGATVALVVLSACGPDPGAPDTTATLSTASATARHCASVAPLSPTPARVVVDHQRIAEIMAALGLADRVVGVLGDMLTVPPDEVDGAVSGMRFLGGGPETPIDDATLQRLRPDVVLLTGAVPRAPTAGRVVELGAACGHARRSIADAVDEITRIGELFGAERAARRVTTDLRADLAAVRARRAGTAGRSVILTGAGDALEPLRPVSGLMAEMVALAGGRDVVPPSGDRADTVRRSDARLFVVVGHGSDLDPSGVLCTISLTARDELFRAFPDVPATRAREALVLPAASSFGGLRIVDDVRWLAGQIEAAAPPRA